MTVSHSFESFFDLISSLQITNYHCSVSACPGTKESLHCTRLYMKSICCTWFKQGTIWAACQRECGKWLLGRTSSVAGGAVCAAARVQSTRSRSCDGEGGRWWGRVGRWTQRLILGKALEPDVSPLSSAQPGSRIRDGLGFNATATSSLKWMPVKSLIRV